MEEQIEIEEQAAVTDELTPAEPTQSSAQSYSTLAKALEAARDRLLDRSLRNKLINVNLTNNRARQVRVFDELSDEVFTLLRGGKSLSFAPVAAREATDQPDDNGEGEIPVWVPPEDDDLDARGVAARHRDTRLQTRMTPEGLQKRLLSLYYEGQTIEEEQGVNVLFLAVGFLKWREAKAADVDRFAPLLLLPVELVRDGRKDTFKLTLRPDDLYTNVSLQAWLREQFGIELPELPDADDLTPSDYFASVREAIGERPHWAVEADEVLLGFFSFAKFLLWRDLDPANWPAAEMLTGNPLLERILLRQKDDDAALVDTPLIEEHERVDEIFPPARLLHVTDADSSRAIAIQEALNGKNLVIQGPPGTGKSQTITNIIAGAVHAGKRVLFVAEKMAALEVVHQRLEKQKLGPVCLELHSRKASKAQVLEQIKQGRNAPAPPNWSERVIADVDETQKVLRLHADRLHGAAAGASSAYDLIGRISLLKAQGVAAPRFEIPAAALWSADKVREAGLRAQAIDGRLSLAGAPKDHPWRGAGIDTPDMLAMERIKPAVEAAAAAATALRQIAAQASQLLALEDDPVLSALNDWVDALRHLAGRPKGIDETLCSREVIAAHAYLRSLTEAGAKLRAIRSEIDGYVRPDAWAQDWTTARRVIVGQGRSLFRIFSAKYRDAIADLRGSWNGALPSDHALRVRVLDGLIDGAAASAIVASGAQEAGRLLGPLWQGEGTDWELLTSALDWVGGCTRFANTVDLLQPARLQDVEICNNLADRLQSAKGQALNAFDALAGMVDLDRGMALSGGAVGDLTTVGLALITGRWEDRFHDLVQWPPLRDDLTWLGGIAGALESQVFDGEIPSGSVEPMILLAIAETQWGEVRKREPEIARATGDELDRFVARFRKADLDRIRIAADQVARAHIDRHPTGTAGAVGIIVDEMKKSKRLKPVRKLMKEAGEAVQRFKPVFLMSPLSVAQFLEPGVLEFDLLVIDEASQVRPEDALGAIARSKQVVVVGDDRQLPPTNFFSRMVNDEPEPDEDEASDGARAAAVRDIESILNLCSRFPERMLEWHYRSEHPALIATSNRNFYQNRLKLPPSVLANAGDGSSGLVFHKVQEGGYERGRTARNEIEAEDVAQAVLRHIRQFPDQSLGIGTFSVAQRDCIRDRIDDLARKYPQMDEFLLPNGRREPLFVKNLENIQGDERDVIFISVGYGRDRDGKLTQNFGPVGRDGGERRLNVLITRARKRCEVFSSLVAEDIKAEGAGKPGVVALKEFLKLAKDGYSDFAWATGKDFDSDFEEAVSYAVRELGYECHPQVGMAGFFIDLGVLDPANPDRYIMGIECDGAAYHSSRYSRDRDRLRQHILENRGWKLHRIWSTDWFYRREREVLKLKDAIERAIAGKPLPTAEEAYDPDIYDDEVLFEAPPAAVAASAGLPPYEFADFAHPNLSFEPHRLSPSQVGEIVVRIVEAEQPIHHDEVARRLAGLGGRQRAGSRIWQAAQNGLLWAQRSGMLAHDGPFWTMAGAGDLLARDRSDVLAGEYVRKPDMIAPRELAEAARFALKQNLALEASELIIETARLIGFARTGKDVGAAIQGAIESEYLAPYLVTDHLGRLQLAEL